MEFKYLVNTCCQVPPPFTLPPLQLDPKDSERNTWWQAIFLSNSAEPIAAVHLDGRPLKLSE